MKRIISIVVIMVLVLSLFSFSVGAANDLQHDYSTKSNSGIRYEVCTTLNGTSADQYYTGSYTYENLSELSGSSLLSSLRALMTNTHTYMSSYNDCRDLAEKTDCQNGDGTTVTLIYTGYKATYDNWCNKQSDGWDREHVWPKSLGNFNTSGPGADLHHVRPCDQGINSGARGNKKYGNVTGGSAAKGASYTGNALGGYYNSSYFEPIDSAKGDVARICLYLYVRYGGESSYTCNSITNVFQSIDVLLEWCALDPVDTWEMGRNEVVGAKQGNRNVFIDYPELAWLLFDREIPEDMVTPTSFSYSSGSSGSSTTPTPTDPSEQACAHSSTVIRNEVTATCLSDGYTGDTYCADCGDLISYGEQIPATSDHTFGQWVVEIAPSELQDGHQIRTCSTCGHTETEILPATGPEQTEPDKTEPDETEPESTPPTDAPTKNEPDDDQNLLLIGVPIAVLVIAGVAVLIFVPKKKPV